MKNTALMSNKTEIKCPECNCDAVYKYGKIKTGKQRLICLMCGKQFTPGSERLEAKGKPICPACGRQMHLYKIEGEVIRFRCSAYPACKTFKKFRIKEEGNELLHA
jgi:transposase-like protein